MVAQYPSPQSAATMDQPTSVTTVHPPCPICHETARPRTARAFKGYRTITYICQQCQHEWEVSAQDYESWSPELFHAAH